MYPAVPRRADGPEKPGPIMHSDGTNDSNMCPCGSRHPLADCCGPLLSGERQAQTAEQLMRSRYTAYVHLDEDYLLRTWYPATRPNGLQLGSGTRPQWLGLKIRATQAGQPGDAKGSVEFAASFSLGGSSERLHEISQFVREAGRWYYVDGQIRGPGGASRGQTARNSPCPCGSGKKFKRCCGRSEG